MKNVQVSFTLQYQNGIPVRKEFFARIGEKIVETGDFVNNNGHIILKSGKREIQKSATNSNYVFE